MRFSTSTIAAVASLLMSTTYAHMIMHTPHPYGPDSLNNSPLAADGSDFPCKLRGDGTYADPVAANNLVIGETNYLSFQGSVVHGGGSCQVSLTTDAQPDASSSWEVIHSIIGGCPSNHSGNFDADASSLTDATVFEYSVPSSVTPGTYTLGWTWFNNVGNREMYMNCAPVTITGGSTKRSKSMRHLVPEERSNVETSPNPNKRGSLPAMFVANIGNGCSTPSSTDLVFPDPGDSVLYAGLSTNTKAAPVGSCASGSGSTTEPSSVAGSSAAAVSTPEATSAAAVDPQPTVVATSLPAVDPQPTVVATSAAAPAPVASSAAASPSGTTSSGTTETGACTTEGTFNCINGSTYQVCASGAWSVTMSVAAGTECTVGQSADLGIKFAEGYQKMAKRHINSRIARSHGHARRGAAGSWH